MKEMRGMALNPGKYEEREPLPGSLEAETLNVLKNLPVDKSGPSLSSPWLEK